MHAQEKSRLESSLSEQRLWATIGQTYFVGSKVRLGPFSPGFSMRLRTHAHTHTHN